MFSAKKYPDHLSPEELDEYLYQGWYRLGQAIFTTQFLFFESRVFNAVWIRLDLRGLQFSKSNRKILRTCYKTFEIHYQPLKLTDEKELLYQKYRSDFPGILAPSLKESLQEEFTYNIYDSWEVTLRDQGRLIAYSVFDCGKTSLASIIGVYDPDYRKYSLGMATLLLEIQYGVEKGYEWFYPGYVVPGNPRFDYKLRSGSTQSYDLYTRHWLPSELVLSEILPFELIRQKIMAFSDILTENGKLHKVINNLILEANFYQTEEMEFIDAPCFLLSFDEDPNNQYLAAITYDPHQNRYDCWSCSVLDNFEPDFWDDLRNRNQRFMYPTVLFIKEKRLFSTESLVPYVFPIPKMFFFNY